jgi:hypothetical protein
MIKVKDMIISDMARTECEIDRVPTSALHRCVTAGSGTVAETSRFARSIACLKLAVLAQLALRRYLKKNGHLAHRPENKRKINIVV